MRIFLSILVLSIAIIGCHSEQTLSEHGSVSQQERKATLDPEAQKYLTEAQKCLKEGESELYLSKAYEFCQKALSIEKDSPVVLQTLGVICYLLQYYDEGKGYLQKAQKYEDDPYTLYYLGLIEQELENHLAAIEYFEKALQKKATLKMAYLPLANSLEAVGEESEALECYQKLQNYFPKKWFFYWKAGLIAMKLEKWKEAEKELLAVPNYTKDYPLELHYHLAQIYLAQKRYKDAKREGESYLSKCPEAAPAMEMFFLKIKEAQQANAKKTQKE